jgi:hypothetical protein
LSLFFFTTCSAIFLPTGYFKRLSSNFILSILEEFLVDFGAYFENVIFVAVVTRLLLMMLGNSMEFCIVLETFLWPKGDLFDIF